MVRRQYIGVKRRVIGIVRPVFVLGIILVGGIASGIVLYYDATKVETVIAILCSMSIVIGLRILYELLTSSEPHPEVLTEIKPALDRAYNLQAPAKQNICAMWTQVQYDDTLKNYFADTLKRNVHTIRIIDTENNSISDILDHMVKSWSNLWQGTYEIYLAKRRIDYELLIVDHTSAAIFLYPGPGFGCIFVTHEESSFATNVRGDFDRIKQESSHFPASQLPEQFDKPIVEKWLTTWKNSP